MRGVVVLLAVPVGLTGCFNPDPPAATGISDTDNTTETGDTSSGATVPTGGSSSASGSGPTMPTTDNPTSSPGSESEAGDTVCGDGEVEGAEGCDDGTNDGSYGGCLEDCSGPAAFCGDGDLNGPEACDDGTNDGSYGGCEGDCASLAAYCGDGETNGPEGCDDGDANENGMGCNLDCVISGSVVGSYQTDSHVFCDGEFLTKPALRDNGNVLVAASGYCDTDTLILAEFNSDVELQEDFADGLLLPTTPVREGTLVGDDWLLANYACNYLVSDSGDLTEICEDRNVGDSALAGIDADNYLAVEFNELASFGAGSPALGDSPTWSVSPPNNALYDYGYLSGDLGPVGSALVVGYRRTITGNVYVGYLAQYTAGGNLADSTTFAGAERFYEVAAAPDDTIVVYAGAPDYRLLKFNDNLNNVWDVPLNADSDVSVAVDSTGEIAFTYRNDGDGAWYVRKLDADGTTERWDNPIGTGYNHRLAIDATDHIWVASLGFGNGYEFTVQKFAP